MRRYIILILSVVLVLSFFAVPSVWAKDKLVMGVHPYKPVGDLYKMFKPIADYVSQKIGKPVEFRIGKNYAETVDAVGKGDMDFAFIGPSLYVEARSKYNVTPLAQISNDGKPTFYGVVVAKKGSGISTLSALKGRTFAFGDRDSTLTHIVPLYMLIEAGVQLKDLKQYAFVGTHDNVALNVVRGSFDAAGLQPDIAAKYKDQGLEVIARSADLPEHVFVATKSMDGATMVKIQNALLSMDAKLLKGIKSSVSGIQKFNDKDFDVLRKIMKTVEKERTK